jgi:spore coat protein U-like protein
VRTAAGLLVVLAWAAAAAHAQPKACSFRVRTPATLGFGALDPSNATNRSAILTNWNQVGQCPNVPFTVSADNGLNFSGGTRRMRKGTDFIPYSLVLDIRGTGTAGWLTLPAIGATVAGSAYQNAPAGDYNDALVISVTP